MGPYHFARMGALAKAPNVDLTVVEGSSLDDHRWARTSDSDFELITLTPHQISREVLRNTQRSLLDVLNKHKPDVIVGPGYAQPHCLGPILTYKNSVPSSLVILWSESTAKDAFRFRMKEAFKALLLPVFDGALVAGKPHAEYLKQLRMSAADIQIVGN